MPNNTELRELSSACLLVSCRLHVGTGRAVSTANVDQVIYITTAGISTRQEKSARLLAWYVHIGKSVISASLVSWPAKREARSAWLHA